MTEARMPALYIGHGAPPLLDQHGASIRDWLET